jgi:hypothetical protein
VGGGVARHSVRRHCQLSSQQKPKLTMTTNHFSFVVHFTVSISICRAFSIAGTTLTWQINIGRINFGKIYIQNLFENSRHVLSEKVLNRVYI